MRGEKIDNHAERSETGLMDYITTLYNQAERQLATRVVGTASKYSTNSSSVPSSVFHAVHCTRFLHNFTSSTHRLSSTISRVRWAWMEDIHNGPPNMTAAQIFRRWPPF